MVHSRSLDLALELRAHWYTRTLLNGVYIFLNPLLSSFLRLF
jgi:hypothetical protein